MVKPPRLTDEEAVALQRFFRHVWLGYDEHRQPLHTLLARVDLYITERDLEPEKVTR